MNKYLINLFVVLMSAPAMAQTTESGRGGQLPEKILFRTDRSSYASGDTVWYKAYLVDQKSHKPHPIQEILHLELISENNRVVVSQRLKAEQGSAAASLILPDTLKTGSYMLQAYTNWQRNVGPQAFSRQPVWVNKVPVIPEGQLQDHAASVTNSLKLSLQPSGKIYKRREPVSLNLQLLDSLGNGVMADLMVTATHSTGGLVPSLKRMYVAQPAAANADLNGTVAYERETQLNQLAMAKENDQALKNAIIYLLETNTGATYLLSTNNEGYLRVPVKGSRFFYQVWQNGIWIEEARLTVAERGDMAAVENWAASLPADSLETRRLVLRRQISNTYLPKAAQVKFVNKEMWPSYPANHYYPLEDYNQLNNMEEIFREMVPSVRVITRKKKVQANVYNQDTRTFFPNQPLYIIDGQPTWNNDLFLRLDASQLEQVNIYNSSKTLQPFGFMGNNGVIVVFSKSRNYQNPELSADNILEIPGQNSNSVFHRKPLPANVPDFRPTLYWNPAVHTNPEGKASITFETSDAIGPVRVQVEGITPDGQLVSEEFTIPVQPEQ